ncbi:MAG: YfiR family protein [Pseudomonadota bacterium]|nr:YfiR family protein [Pseudomonadota bacterium]
MKRLLAALLLLVPLIAAGQALEHEIKAAFVFKFLSFVEWPAQAFARPETPISIGVLGAEEVYNELQEIVPGRVVQGRPVTVRRVREGESLNGLHVLYVGRGGAPVLAKLGQARNLLVITEWDGALDQGGIINFVHSEGRVRFEVALDTAERRGLHISSRMLAVAQNVRSAKPL